MYQVNDKIWQLHLKFTTLLKCIISSEKINKKKPTVKLDSVINGSKCPKPITAASTVGIVLHVASWEFIESGWITSSLSTRDKTIAPLSLNSNSW